MVSLLFQYRVRVDVVDWEAIGVDEAKDSRVCVQDKDSQADWALLSCLRWDLWLD